MNIIDVARKYHDIKAEGGGLLGYWPLLAGGAIRDALMGLDPKDFDLYIPLEAADGKNYGEASMEAAVHFSKAAAEKFKMISPPAPEEYHINGIAPAGHYEIAGVDCNLILWDRGLFPDVTANFDYTCCIGAYTGGKFRNLDAVATAIASGQLYLNNRNLNRNQIRSTIHMAEKFMERYGWTTGEETKSQILIWRGENYIFD